MGVLRIRCHEFPHLLRKTCTSSQNSYLLVKLYAFNHNSAIISLHTQLVVITQLGAQIKIYFLFRTSSFLHPETRDELSKWITSILNLFIMTNRRHRRHYIPFSDIRSNLYFDISFIILLPLPLRELVTLEAFSTI